MMTGRVVAVALCVFLVGGGCAKENPLRSAAGGGIATQAEQVQRQAQIERFLEKSGMNHMFDILPEQVAMGFDQQPPPPVNREEYLAFRSALIDAFEPQRVRTTVMRHFEQAYDAEKMARVLAMLEMPLVEKMTEAELEAQSPQAQMEMMQMGNIIMGQASPERMALVRRFDEVSGASEFALAMQMMMAEVTMRNMNRIVPEAQRLSPEQLERMLSEMRMQSIYPIRQGTLLNMLYTYRSFSDDELMRYIELHESDHSRWVTEVMKGALMAVTRQAAEDLSEQINRTILNQRAL